MMVTEAMNGNTETGLFRSLCFASKIYMCHVLKIPQKGVTQSKKDGKKGLIVTLI